MGEEAIGQDICDGDGGVGRAAARRHDDSRRWLWLCGIPENLIAAIRSSETRDLTVISNNAGVDRSEEHTSELQSLMRISYAVFCLKKKKNNLHQNDQRHRVQHYQAR